MLRSLTGLAGAVLYRISASREATRSRGRKLNGRLREKVIGSTPRQPNDGEGRKPYSLGFRPASPGNLQLRQPN